MATTTETTTSTTTTLHATAISDVAGTKPPSADDAKTAGGPVVVPTIARNSKQTSKPMPSFYRRPLPSSCIAFSSPKGRQIFASALQNKGLRCFFSLMEQHTTQSEPAYCGLSTLVVALNAFAIDPRQNWKGPWRWYQEEMLNCCLDSDEVKASGITIQDFACLAKCQSVDTDVHYHDSPSGSLEAFRETVIRVCQDQDEDDDTDNHAATNDTAELSTEASHPREILVVSYNRKRLGQTGSGHFSPVGAYDPVSDAVLILDTARFKYGAHWVPLPLLHAAMEASDPTSGRSRGFLVLSRMQEDTAFGSSSRNDGVVDLSVATASTVETLLYQVKFSDRALKTAADFANFLAGYGQDKKVLWQDVYNYWTKNGEDSSHIWEILMPQLKPSDANVMDDLRERLNLIRDLVQALPPTSGPASAPSGGTLDPITAADCKSAKKDCDEYCQPNGGRSLPLRALDAIFLVYLASLDPHRRRCHVNYGKSNATDEVQKKLFMSVEILEQYFVVASEREKRLPKQQ